MNSTGKRLLFVVQKHAATRLHYDFRLELGDVLVSWAIPKGPSADTGVKRLATRVEDHAIEYADFEGTISEGSYGAGGVIVWDTGDYWPEAEGGPEPETREEAEALIRRKLDAGKLAFTLHGKKLKGSWALVKMRKEETAWLLIKHRDEYANPENDILADGHSVISGRTIEELD
ncbi:MAG TPA: DNA polymerase ligase N-terminal domain-containing protein [Chloroflexota bacterium]